MALVTRIGASNANSFVTLDQADYVIGQLPDDPAEWEALTTQEKEYRLILAANIVGMLPLRGRKVYKNQALSFPRTVYDADEERWRYEADSRRIPGEVREAQVQIAYSVVHRALMNRGSVSSQVGSTVVGVSLGGALSVNFSPNKSQTGSLLDLLMKSLQAPIYIKMVRWLSQIRIRSITATDDEDYWEAAETLPTTTTTTTTTTSFSTTSSTSSTAP